jgi:hypothetical protein
MTAALKSPTQKLKPGADRACALVSSANFSETGQRYNFEADWLVREPWRTVQVSDHDRRMVEEGFSSSCSRDLALAGLLLPRNGCVPSSTCGLVKVQVMAVVGRTRTCSLTTLSNPVAPTDFLGIGLPLLSPKWSPRVESASRPSWAWGMWWGYL